MGTIHAERLDGAAFQRVLTELIAPIDVRPTQNFEGRIRNVRYDDVYLSRLAASEHSARGVRQRYGQDMAIFVRVTAGHVHVAQNGRTAHLAPGDMFVYQPDRPYMLNFESEYETVGVVVPLSNLSGFSKKVTSLTAVRLGAENPLVDAVGSIADTLESRVATLPTHLALTLVRSVVEAIDTMCGDVVVAAGLASPVKMSRLQEALQTIDDSLDDPGLSPNSVAASMHVSRRTLYSIFEEAEMSVSDTIRRRRLEKCRVDLIDPSKANESIARIGSRWGFLSPAHFSTSFRTVFGTSPSEWRHQALDSAR